jgi:6-phosphofructokinase 1
MGRDCGYLALISAVTCGAEVCIVSEGAKVTNKIASWIEDEVGIQARVTILGHTQRGGNPTVYDRLMAFKFSRMAVDKLLSSKDVHEVVVFKNSEFKFVSIEKINSARYEIEPEFLELADRMVR